MVWVAAAMLLARDGPEGETRIPISGAVTMIGRASFNDVVAEDTAVSRQHARIQKDSAGHWIIDSGSANGTYVNGERLGTEPQLLRHLDLIELGSTGAAVNWVFIHSQATTKMPRLDT